MEGSQADQAHQSSLLSEQNCTLIQALEDLKEMEFGNLNILAVTQIPRLGSHMTETTLLVREVLPQNLSRFCFSVAGLAF